MTVPESIINNVRSSKLHDLLREKNAVIQDDESGIDLHFLLSKMIEDKRILSEDINKCLYQELMYGDRRLIRFYELKSVRKLKTEISWKDLLSVFNCPSMNFNRILETTLNENEHLKVAAISTTTENSLIKTVNILFVYNMKMKSKDNYPPYFYSYLPVSFDLSKKTLTLKVRNKEDGEENNTPLDQMNSVFATLVNYLCIETNIITNNPQKVLYRMSKDLFDNFYKQLPNFSEVERKKDVMDDIVNNLLSNITLKNAKIVNGKITMNSDIINVSEEMYKLLQQVALYDYLENNEITTLLKNTNVYISRIRFNDIDNLTASLTNEGRAGVKCIFDAKTFMCVRNSLDLTECIVSIVVSFVQDRGLLTVKYDASDKRFISIHILQNRYYGEDDYTKIWELYKKYESEDNATTSTICAEYNVAAM